MSMYNPGNAVVVNLLMRWPKLIPVAAAVGLTTTIKTEQPPLPPAPPAITAPAPVAAPPTPVQLPVLPPQKKKRG